MGYGKWITGALGWVIGGPIGGIAGFIIGSLFDGNVKVDVGKTPQGRRYSPVEERNSFMVSLLVLASAVMKADGKIMKSELDYVKAFLLHNFGPDAAKEATLYLKTLLEKDVDVVSVGAQIRSYMNYESRVQLLHFLTGIAQADGFISPEELALLRKIAAAMGISARESEAIFAMFDNGADAAYQILEIERTASDEEVKRAYKRLAAKHHPDKVASLGADVQKSAEERFKKISEAYEKIKKERRMN